MISQPFGAVINIDGNIRFTIGKKQKNIYLTKGKHKFYLTFLNSGVKIYGVFEVIRVSNAIFGLQRAMFKKTHIDAALQGRPVFYDINLDGRPAIKYKLSRRKL